jgi:hypothetical protein
MTKPYASLNREVAHEHPMVKEQLAALQEIVRRRGSKSTSTSLLPAPLILRCNVNMRAYYSVLLSK